MICSSSLQYHHPNKDRHFQLLQSFKSPLELKQVHAHLLKTSNSSSSLSLLSLSRVASICALTPSLPYARRIFHSLAAPELALWNSHLKALAPNDAVSLFRHLLEAGVVPDSFTLSLALNACSRLHDIGHGKLVHGLVEKLGFGDNLVLRNSILNLYAISGELGDAKLMFDTMPERDTVSWNALMARLAERGEIEEAYEMFLAMPERNVRSWTLMISGFVRCGKAKKAVQLFLEMEASGVEPNEVTVVAVLAACADLGDLFLGRKLHDYSERSGFGRNDRVSNTLLDMYVKCGCLDEARRIFEAIKGRRRTVVSWSAMIAGLAAHGEGEKAVSLFSEMVRDGVRPNGVTFVGLLHACSHMGMVDQGREFFAAMERDYGVAPKIEHYGCMVDLLSRAGLLKEAYDFIVNMPIKSNGVVWGAFLGGCKVHKNVAFAEEAIKHLSELNPLNDGYYVVLSNIYAEAGRWDDTVRTRKLMRQRGVKKTPGFSAIEIDGTIHEFVAGDESHPRAAEIFERWEQLLVEMARRGYIPDTSVVLLDVEEGEKRRFLSRHSEKLALAFGLIKTEPGTTIRIMKNLRVCEDCHEAFKLISAIEDREIIVRDRNRFHCFKEGSCSCKDYW